MRWKKKRSEDKEAGKVFKDMGVGNMRDEEEKRKTELTIGIEFDGNNYVEIPAFKFVGYHITGDSENFSIAEITENEVTVFNRALSSEEIEDLYFHTNFFCGSADRVLTDEEYSVLHDLLKNHPEIKSWAIKNNILYIHHAEDPPTSRCDECDKKTEKLK